MATMTATKSNYSESVGKYETDDTCSTATFHTGYSSDYRSGVLAPSRLSRHSAKIKASSSFPNLLSLYQSPIREESNLHVGAIQTENKPKKPKRERKERKVKKAPSQSPKQDFGNDDSHEKRQRHEMRKIRMDAVAREQLDKFDEYVKTMNTKVERQREDRKKYNETLQERLKEQEEAERKKLRLHRGPKHVYVNDNSYLKRLPVSNYCKTLRMADDLQKKGVLRTRNDVERFWAGYGNNQQHGIDIFDKSSATSVNYPQHWIMHRKPEIKVTEDDEDSEITDALGMTQTKQLPPIRRIKQKH